jgi:tetratricopeptide (TPR) repeat protein
MPSQIPVTLPNRLLRITSSLLLLGAVTVPSLASAAGKQPPVDEAKQALERGKAALEKDDLERAVSNCTEAIRLRSDFAEAYYYRGEAYRRLYKSGNAIDDCTKAIEIRPNYADAYRCRGGAYVDKHDYDRGIADFSKAIRIDPTDAKAFASRGDAFRDKDLFDKAITDYTESIRLDPKNGTVYGCRAFAYAGIGQHDKCLHDFEQGIAVTPDNWNVRNNFGVYLWLQAQQQDARATKAEAAGDLKQAKECRDKSEALKNDAVQQWVRGITSRPTATDIHSNLGYAYSDSSAREEAKGNLAKAEELLNKSEWHLNESVRLKPVSPRPRNNLGRVLLRRSQQFDAEAKTKTDPAEARRLKALAKTKLDAAIEQFEKAVELDPSLLEAQLNLGEVYFSLNNFDKATFHYKAIQSLESPSIKDTETINNFSQACFGLARIALARNKHDEAVAYLQHALELNPRNVAALQLLATEHFQRGEFRDGENALRRLLAMLPKVQRRNLADHFGGQLEAAGKHKEAIRAWNSMAWTFATSPEPQILDPEAAMKLAQRVAKMTNLPDAASLDTLAAATAASGHFKEAAETAQAAIDQAKARGNKPLADAIGRRLKLYQQQKAYTSEPDGRDRP